MSIVNINGKPATRIKGILVENNRLASLFDCEGDKIWLPNSTVRDNEDGTIDIQDWIYKQKFK